MTGSGAKQALAKNLPCSRVFEAYGPDDSATISPQENQRLHETGLPVSCNRRHHQLIRCVFSL
jgi:hypothetical protein